MRVEEHKNKTNLKFEFKGWINHDIDAKNPKNELF
jgi:hypothetical protein